MALAQCSHGMDVYTLCGINPTWYSCIRVMICSIIQLGVTGLMVYDSMDGSQKGSCSRRGGTHGRIGCVAVACYTFFLFWREYLEQTSDENPFIESFHKKKFLSQMNSCYIWGMFVNIWTVFLTSVGSVVLIYNQEDVINIVLNALALAFVIALDDELVTERDYKEVVQIVEKWSKNQDDNEQELSTFYQMTMYIVTVPMMYATGLILFLSPLYLGICY
uniref:Uncharacterized protein n=1 Tax=Fibrocapsa japonica TaxID=94617 RepID=A0A6U1MUI2_9STRA